MARQSLWPFLLVLAGCSSSTATFPVQGVVTLEGKVVPQVSVLLVPVSERVKPAKGVTDMDGQFQAVTAGEGRGVFPGQYKVLVIGAPNSSSPGIPPHYADTARTPIVVEVPLQSRFEVRLARKEADTPSQARRAAD